MGSGLGIKYLFYNDFDYLFVMYLYWVFVYSRELVFNFQVNRQLIILVNQNG